MILTRQVVKDHLHWLGYNHQSVGRVLYGLALSPNFRRSSCPIESYLIYMGVPNPKVYADFMEFGKGPFRKRMKLPDPIKDFLRYAYRYPDLWGFGDTLEALTTSEEKGS